MVQKNQGAKFGMDLTENFDKLVLPEKKPTVAESTPAFPGFDIFRFESSAGGNSTELTFRGE